MDQSEVVTADSHYCRRCSSCRTWTRCKTIEELQQVFSGLDGRPVKSCQTCRANKTTKTKDAPFKRTGFDLDEYYQTHEDFIESVSSFLELNDNHITDVGFQSLRIKATLAPDLLIENDMSMTCCAQDTDLQRRAVILLRNDMFDCSGYFFHLRKVNERKYGPKFHLTCSRSVERKTERDPLSVKRYTESKEFFNCRGELHISFSKSNGSAIMIYEHCRHPKPDKFHMTPAVESYIEAHKHFAPRQIYQNLLQMMDSQFERTELYTITRQQVYNVWRSINKTGWERDAANDYKSAQLLLAEQDGYRLVEGLQEPGVSLAFLTPCFTDRSTYSLAKMTEVFIDSTFGTNKHGYELYCILTEYDLVSLPLSYLLLDTRGIQVEGKRGSRLTAWFTALRHEGLRPNVVHTDKDFAEVTAASIAFKRDNSNYNHHLCLWHSLRAIDQHLTGKVKGSDAIDSARNSLRMSALPNYLHFLSDETDWILSKGQTKQCTSAQASILRGMVKGHLLRHPLLPKVAFDNADPQQTLLFETYEEIHASSIKELLGYCKSIDQHKVFRYFWSNWYRPEFRNSGSRWEIASLCGRPGSVASIPISRTTMRLESHWRILKKDYSSHLVRPRLDVLCYIIFNGLVRSRIQLHLQIAAGREKPSVYKDFVHVWRKCAEAVDRTTIDKRDGFYFTHKDKWVCSCPAFVFNSRYLCKHLVSYFSSPHPDGNGRYVVQPPPSFTPDLFQERLPLIRFNDFDLAVPVAIGSGIELSDSGDADTGPSAYAQELASFQLSLSENPEVREDNDEESLGLLRILHWATGDQCENNPRMQRDICRSIRSPEELIKKFKRPYEEALGSSRAMPGHTMRKAPKSYYYMRPNNDYAKEN
ncbi:hypothetical protein V1527DRAFT_493571 [Lipomyces starkeyi]